MVDNFLQPNEGKTSLCVPDVFVIKITEALGPLVTFPKSSMGIPGATLYLILTLKCHIVFHYVEIIINAFIWCTGIHCLLV